MSHTTIYFLAEAENQHRAESRVNACLETENFYDYSGVIPEQSGPLDRKQKELAKFLDGWNWKNAAGALLNEAEDYKANDNWGMYGYCLIRAGELYSQSLTVDTCVFNINTADYSIPEHPGGWWVIAVDFHY